MNVSDQRIAELIDIFSELANTSGGMERTSIWPSLSVIDASPSNLSADYIIIEDSEGFYIPALRVPGVTYSNGDLVNVLFVKGAEPIAFQQGPGSGGGGGGGGWPFSGIITVSTTDPDADYANIPDAITAAVAGNLIMLDAETFTGVITVNKNITIYGPGSTITSSGAATVTITSTCRILFPTITNTGTGLLARTILIDGASDVVIEAANIDKLSGAATTSAGVHLINNAFSVELRRCRVRVGAGPINYGVYGESFTSLSIVGGAISGDSIDVYCPDATSQVSFYELPFMASTGFSGSSIVKGHYYSSVNSSIIFPAGNGMSGGVWLHDASTGFNIRYSTLPDAVSAASAGDKIKLFTGTYTLASTLSVGVAIEIEGDGLNTIITCAVSNVPTIDVTANNVTFRNLTIAHTSTGTTAGPIATDNTGLVLDNVFLDGTVGTATTKYGLWMYGAGSARLVNCRVSATAGTTRRGLMITVGAGTITVENSEINGSTADIFSNNSEAVINLRSTILTNNTIDWAGIVNYSDDNSYERARPNPIINGSMLVWQRGTSFAAIANGALSADCWIYGVAGTAVHTISRSTDVPTVAQAGVFSLYSLLLDCTTADASIDAGDLTVIQHRMEGYNWWHLAQRAFTVSFWVKATKTGTYCFSVRNTGNDRSYVAEYTINTANTWEYKSLVIPASPSAGTWDYTNGIGARLMWTIACGSTFQTTPGTWQTGNFFGTSNQVNGTDSTANDFRLALVKAEPGNRATRFVMPDPQEELGRCYRYCFVLDASSNTVNKMTGGKFSTTLVVVNRYPPVPFRATPVLTHNVTGYTAGNPGTTTVGLLDFGSGGYSTLTGALTFAAAVLDTDTIGVTLTAGTSWTGTNGHVFQLRIGPDVRLIFAADL